MRNPSIVPGSVVPCGTLIGAVSPYETLSTQYTYEEALVLAVPAPAHPHDDVLLLYRGRPLPFRILSSFDGRLS